MQIFVALHLSYKFLCLMPDVIDGAIPVIAYKKCPIWCKCYAHRSAADIAVTTEPACNEIFSGTCHLSIFQRDADDLVARGDGPVPGAMKGHIQAIAVARRELRRSQGREIQSQGRRVGLHLLKWLLHTLAGVCRLAELGIVYRAGMTARPAVVPLIYEFIERLGRNVVAHQVASIHVGPDLLVPGIDDHAHGVAQPFREEFATGAIQVIDPDGCSMRVLLDADIARGADADVHTIIRPDQHCARVVLSACGQCENVLDWTGLQTVAQLHARNSVG